MPQPPSRGIGWAWVVELLIVLALGGTFYSVGLRREWSLSMHTCTTCSRINMQQWQNRQMWGFQKQRIRCLCQSSYSLNLHNWRTLLHPVLSLRRLPEECTCFYHLLTEVFMWFDHLQTISHNSKQGAARATETHWKRKVKAKEDYRCGICHKPYIDFMEEIEKWIGCEGCKSFHLDCVGHVTEPNMFIWFVGLYTWFSNALTVPQGCWMGEYGVFDSRGCHWWLGKRNFRRSNPHLCPHVAPTREGGRGGHNIDRPTTGVKDSTH